MSSPSVPPQSEDDLFNPQTGGATHYETIETVPLSRARDSPDSDTFTTLPPLLYDQNTQRRGLTSQSQNGYKSGNTAKDTYQTQPTQLLDLPSEVSSPPTKPVVQVTASSPVSTPAPPVARSTGILASAMAPAGTAFRRPFVAAAVTRRTQPITIDSDEDERALSSDSDRAEQARNNIKTSTFKRAADKVPESPQGGSGLSRFQQLTQGFGYRNANYAAGLKRSSDVMANAYGNVHKKSRQTEPSRAFPVSTGSRPQPDMELDDILDINARSKVRRLRALFADSYSIRDMYQALQTKRGNFEDAAEHMMQLSEKNAKKANVVDLGSEDELMMTPAATKKKLPPVTTAASGTTQDTRQQARKPTKTINEKWSSTQGIAKKALQNKKLDVFDDPGPAQPKARKLMRGRRDPSPVAQTSNGREDSDSTKPILVLSDDSDGEAEPAAHSELEDGDFSDRLLSFFNTCSAMDLADTASISRDIAEHFVSKRPYKSIEAINKVENPNLKPAKSRRKAPPLGEKIVDKVDSMLRSYEAVDYLVQKCEGIAKPLASEMKSWGVDVYGNSGSGELDMTNLRLDAKSAANNDSGLGTPISDDDRDNVRGPVVRRLIGQPISMAEGITMKDYQVVGLNWLNLLYRKRYSCILADDMGLGKTLQTIAFLAHLAETGVRGPTLIVVPAATLENWLKEFARFCPSLAVEPYYAPNPTERFDLRETIDKMRDEINVIITTYTIAKAKDDFPWLRSFGFCCTIFDEGHVLKNADSKVSRNLMRIRSQWRLLLTGTPLQNNLKELMSLLFFLMPDMFKQKQEDLELIFKQDVKTINEDAESREMLLSKKRIARARSMLTPFILRRKKWQVLKDLPKKERKVEYCDLTINQADIYNGWLAKAFDIRERRANGDSVPADESTNILMRLRQAAIHPLLFRHHYTDGHLRKIAKACLRDPQWESSNPDLIFTELLAYSDFEIHQLCVKSKPLQKFILTKHEMNTSGKVQAMVRLLKHFMSEGHRTLIFSQFVMVLDILELILSDEGVRFFRLDGNTKVSERQDLIDEFNEEIDDNDPDAAIRRAEQVPVFMLSTKAGGAGINLASASRVIVFDSGFNPQDDVQAENRAHRIGQKKAVEVWRLVTKGTVEEQIHGMGEVKLRLDKEVAGEGAEPEGQENVGDPGKKEGEEKEVEGRRVVEEMFFKKLDTSPRKVPAARDERITGTDAGEAMQVDHDEKLAKEVIAGEDDATPLTGIPSDSIPVDGKDQDISQSSPFMAKLKINDDQEETSEAATRSTISDIKPSEEAAGTDSEDSLPKRSRRTRPKALSQQ